MVAVGCLPAGWPGRCSDRSAGHIAQVPAPDVERWSCDARVRGIILNYSVNCCVVFTAKVTESGETETEIAGEE